MSQERINELTRRLRRHMNGTVACSMRERGICYSINYGVDVVSIKEIASSYATDHSLAKLLYQSPARELMLAATMIADPALVTCDELDFWSEGVINTEVAEHLAIMLCRSDVSLEVFLKWGRSEKSLLVYVALLTACRIAAKSRSEIVRIIAERDAELAALKESYNLRAYEILKERLE